MKVLVFGLLIVSTSLFAGSKVKLKNLAVKQDFMSVNNQINDDINHRSYNYEETLPRTIVDQREISIVKRTILRNGKSY